VVIAEQPLGRERAQRQAVIVSALGVGTALSAVTGLAADADGWRVVLAVTAVVSVGLAIPIGPGSTRTTVRRPRVMEVVRRPRVRYIAGHRGRRGHTKARDQPAGDQCPHHNRAADHPCPPSADPTSLVRRSDPFHDGARVDPVRALRTADTGTRLCDLAAAGRLDGQIALDALMRGGLGGKIVLHIT
jgi:hypothetical protein